MNTTNNSPANMGPSADSLDEVRSFFSGDRFATDALDAQIDEASVGRSRVSMTVKAQHRNAMGNVMGGVYYTLGDFAFAVAACTGQRLTVSASSSLDNLKPAQGDTLRAVCHIEKDGSRLCFGRVDIFDGENTLCARMNVTGCRV